MDDSMKEFLFGKGMSQKPGSIGAFVNFFGHEKFDRIIELGTGFGTLSAFLAFGQFLSGGDFFTFEQRPVKKRRRDRIVYLGGHVVDNTDIWAYVPDIKELIREKKRVLVLCDNGNKIKEVNTFAHALKKDDVIMAHDYWPNGKNRSLKLKYGPWSCEITLADIIDTLRECGISPWFVRNFEPVHWFCGRKRND